MNKALLIISLLGIGIHFWGRAEHSILAQICGFALVIAMFGVFMVRRRASR